MLPFSNVAQAILLERDYFIEPPSSCTLLSPGCQSSMNYPVNCPNGRWYQPPLPYNVTIGGMSYDQVTRNDIDCSEDLWSGSGACTYDWCRALFDGKAEGALVTSFPFIVAAVISPFIGIFVDKVHTTILVSNRVLFQKVYMKTGRMEGYIERSSDRRVHYNLLSTRLLAQRVPNRTFHFHGVRKFYFSK